jgi:hypothetical protein
MTCCGCAFTPTRRGRPQFYCCTSHRWLWWEFRRIQVQELALFDRDSIERAALRRILRRPLLAGILSRTDHRYPSSIALTDH